MLGVITSTYYRECKSISDKLDTTSLNSLTTCEKTHSQNNLPSMTLEIWAALTLALVLGAMAPGPSLALVLRNTIEGGRKHGILTGLGHGLGFGIYAFATAAGMSIALAAHPSITILLRWGGVAMLVWMGYTFIRRATTNKTPIKTSEPNPQSGRIGFVQGFLLALLNPKILAWMLAVYSPFIKPGAPISTYFTMSALATCTDAGWYITVAALLSGTRAINILRANAHIVDGTVGTLMLLFAGLLAGGVF